MARQPLTLFLLMPLLLGAARPAHWAAKVPNKNFPNLHQVGPLLYRSAQYDKKALPEIKKLGIGTVVSLRAFNGDTKHLDGTKWADWGVEKYLRIRFNTWHAEDEDVVKFLDIMTDPALKRPVLVHCKHGADRTGTMCAIYRIVVQGWSKEDAIEEMKKGGYGYHTVWKNLVVYLKNLDVAKLKSKLKHPPG